MAVCPACTFPCCFACFQYLYPPPPPLPNSAAACSELQGRRGGGRRLRDLSAERLGRAIQPLGRRHSAREDAQVGLGAQCLRRGDRRQDPSRRSGWVPLGCSGRRALPLTPLSRSVPHLDPPQPAHSRQGRMRLPPPQVAAFTAPTLLLHLDPLHACRPP